MLAAFLLGQLENMDLITRSRERVYRLYSANSDEELLTLPTIPPDCEANYHMFFILLNSLSARSRLKEHLKSRSIILSGKHHDC